MPKSQRPNLIFLYSSNFLTSVVFAALLGIVAFPQPAIAQSPIKNQPSSSDWKKSIPVSMNGKIDKSWPPNWKNANRGFSTIFWHDKFWSLPGRMQIRTDWKGNNFFKNPKMVELCVAIFAKDVPRMERLIAAGADINTVGEDGMTLLFWAFHVDEDPRPFACLLKHGANPNIITHLGRRKEIQLAEFPRAAVVHLVSSSRYNRLFKSVFEHGGDPNLTWKISGLGTSTSPFLLINVDAPDAVERFQLLLDKGAKLNDRYGNGASLLSRLTASSDENSSRLALVALKAGASFQDFYAAFGCHFRLIHFLAKAKPAVDKRPMDERIHYYAVVDWLEKHGESMADAQADLVRWDKWKSNGQLDLIEKEHKERLAAKAAKKTSGGG